MWKASRLPLLFAWVAAAIYGRRVQDEFRAFSLEEGEDYRQLTSELSLPDRKFSSAEQLRTLASYLFASAPRTAHSIPARKAMSRRPQLLHRRVGRNGGRMAVTKENGYNANTAEIPNWETGSMPTYSYSEDFYQTLWEGMRDCRDGNEKILPLLSELRTRDFFSFFAIDIMASCRHMPTEEMPCELERCEIEPAEDVPESIETRDRNEYDFEMDGWARKDMPSDFTEYFDLRHHTEKNTGYNGTRVWRFIHKKICFNRNLEGEGNGWRRDFNRAVSGMHAAVDAQILNDIGFTEEGREQYHRRLRDEPGSIENLYFAYMLTLNAIFEIRERLNNCNYLGDGESIRPIMRELTASDLLNSEVVRAAAKNLREHTTRDDSSTWKIRMRNRNIHGCMDCVQCNSCKLHGKVMALGLGAAMQVLLGSDGRGGDPLALDRTQVAALVATAAKFGMACDTVEKFREFDGEDMSKPFGVAA